MERHKGLRLALILGLGALPFAPLPVWAIAVIGIGLVAGVALLSRR